MPKLYVVATPIGNLGDLTPRAAQALGECDLIAAEDTRVTAKLTAHLGIRKPMLSCHRHNEDMRAETLIEKMIAEDLTVALTCDAGTPAVSDPGSVLVRAAWEAGIPVVPVSGPSAAVTALSACGFDSAEFAFFGFLPREKKALTEKLASIRAAKIPVCVFYESPHRVVALTRTIAECWPECRLCVCCDLTKKFELILRGSADDVLARLAANPNTEKGEYCLVADLSALPPEEKPETQWPCELALTKRLLDGDDMEDAGAALSRQGYVRNEIYKAKLRVKKRFPDA